MVGVGVIGTGFGRAVHIPGFLALQNAAVVGVASHSYERARQVAEEFSLPRCFATWRELIECSEIEAVSVATPPFLHEEIVLTALDAGKAVLCEKPLALNAAQARRMLEAARRTRSVHMVNFEFREIPVWQFVKRLVEIGELGALRHVNINWVVHSWADPKRPWTWRADRSQGGGTLAARGVHVFDYVEWLIGPVKSLSTHLITRIPQRPDQMGMPRSVDAEDCCHILLELCDGTPVNLVISAVATVGKGHRVELYGEHKAIVFANDDPTDYGNKFEIWEGKWGSAKFRKRRLSTGLQFQTKFEDSRLAPFVNLAQRFIDAVENKNMEVRPSFVDGLRARLLMDLALEAQQERRWIDVPAVMS